MSYSVTHIAEIISAKAVLQNELEIEHLATDSRKVFSPDGVLFFALPGPRRTGHEFIQELYDRGVRNFVVTGDLNYSLYPGANFLVVNDSLRALQDLAAFHRKQFELPVIGITGSNGKTVVKEWLFQLLHAEFNISRSPKSFNSQIGVPLSVWQLNQKNTLGIFEAGISRPGEMDRLEMIIQPTFGILTNIGEAHSEGFASIEQKEEEKRKLFKHAMLIERPTVSGVKRSGPFTIITASFPGSSQEVSIEIPFTDDASIQNATTCWAVMRKLGYEQAVIRERMKQLTAVDMRLELKKGINNCLLINDSYSADTDSLEIALNFLDQQKMNDKKTVILSDFLQSAVKDEELYSLVLAKLKQHGIGRLIAIGNGIGENLRSKQSESLVIEFYTSTEQFMNEFLSSKFRDETILIKGARVFGFERIVQLLQIKSHQTVLEINLAAIAHNLKEYQRLLLPFTKVMAMVKAFAYGSGGAEIASILQFHKTDFLGVAYADEGVELRKGGIHLPIMVMNPEEHAFEKIVEYNLEPELYSFHLLEQFEAFLQNEGIGNYPVHIEFETGMNRLGFSVMESGKLATRLRSSAQFHVRSVFTHLAASEEVAQDAFTRTQYETFQTAAKELEKELGYPFIRHIANSAAAARHSQLQLDMVRLGIGLYGVDSSSSPQLHLQTVATLRSTISQVKHLRKGETVSYNRKGKVERDAVIATIRIGYADGYPRRLGNGIGKVFIKDQLRPIIGTICMDMFMVDITGMDNVTEGDEVIIFGKELTVTQVAEWAGTIPYEIMTGISQRVHRVYYQE